MIDRNLDDGDARRLNSALTWHEWLDDAAVPTPETVFTTDALTFGPPERLDTHGYRGDYDVDAIADTIDAAPFDYPVFVRTDQASAKHGTTNLTESGFIQDEDDIMSTVGMLLQQNEAADLMGLPYRCLMLREKLDLASDFVAFGGTPIAPEVRVFVDASRPDGPVECTHFYWPEEAIRRPNSDDWKEHRDRYEEIAFFEDANIRDRARRVARSIDVPDLEARDPKGRDTDIDPAKWSVDFALTPDGVWYAIDAALAALSWHPDHDDAGKGE